MARVLRHIVIIFLVLAWAGAAVGEATYSIDGDISDWGVDLETYKLSYWNHYWFVQDSFVPDPVGTIDYEVQDYWASDNQPAGGEAYDIEAVYFDDDAETFYFGVISSLSWDASISTTISVTANGHTVTSPFSSFAAANLGIEDGSLPNYFFEGSIPASEFGDPDAGTFVSIAVTEACGNDSICMTATRDSDGPSPGPGPVIPEPGTMALLGLGLAGLVARKRRR